MFSNEQGSSGDDRQVIGFTAFINDMNKEMECSHRKFVDSRKLKQVGYGGRKGHYLTGS